MSVLCYIDKFVIIFIYKQIIFFSAFRKFYKKKKMNFISDFWSLFYMNKSHRPQARIHITRKIRLNGAVQQKKNINPKPTILFNQKIYG